MPVRILLDTNVVVSALLWRGKPYQLLDAVRQRSDVQLCSSPALLAELADVLTRPSAVKRLTIIGRAAGEVMADYVEAIEVVEPDEVPRVVPMDADDDHVIAAAMAAGAQAIVSGDADLLSMSSYRGIVIVSPGRAAEMLGEEAAR